MAYDERPPHMPPGWVAIPKVALKRVGAQAMLSKLDLEQMKDPDSYLHHVRVRMFIDVANLLDRDYGHTIDASKDERGDERWSLTLWLVDPEYLKAQERRLKESRSTVSAAPT